MNHEPYLHLLKKALTRYPLEASDREFLTLLNDFDETLTREIRRCLCPQRSDSALELACDLQARAAGCDWPTTAEIMIGLRRLENLQHCVAQVLEQNVDGDLIETGVWRGGACIFMRAILKAFGDTRRNVWLADSFMGLPKPDPQCYPADQGDRLWSVPQLAVSLETVKLNFERYGLLDEQVRFLPGWFRDTLPAAPIAQLALLRLDGDLYESTMVALRALYPKVSKGGYVIVDDYGAMPSCRQAVNDFRQSLGIAEPVHQIDWTGAFWKVEKPLNH